MPSLQTNDTILLKFHANWCAPCRAMAPALESAIHSFASIRFESVDVDIDPNRAALYNVRSIPTLVLVKDGQPAARLVGIHSKEEIEAFISANT